MSFYLEPRSDNYDYESETDEDGFSIEWSAIFWFPVVFVFACFIGLLPFLLLIFYFLADIYSTTKITIETGKVAYPSLAYIGVLLAIVLDIANDSHPENALVHPSPFLISALGFILIFTILPCLALGLHSLTKIHLFIKAKFGGMRSHGRYLALLGILLGAIVVLSVLLRPGLIPAVPVKTPTLAKQLILPLPTQAPKPNSITVPGRSMSILVDDFIPQPYQGGSIYFFNRLEGDRGAINNSLMDWGKGEVTTTVSSGNSWGGVWMSPNHPIREGLPINFSAILPPQILPAYQSQITGMTVRIARGTPRAVFRLELKNHGDLQWKHEIALTGGDQTIGLELPPLGNINEFVWVLDRAAAGDYVVLDSVSLTATTSITDTATTAFVWSYGMLLNNWNPTTGLVRDKAKDASGEFDAIQATGSVAAATAVAEQLGIVERGDAVQIVNTISDTLLLDMPRFHGLWPHFVRISPTGVITIAPNTEWSSVDTVIAAIGLLAAQSGLGLDTSGTEQMLQAIDWKDLVTPNGISHGYTYAGILIPYAWDTFGGESWLVELAYAGATDQVASMAYPSPPTANGAGFIDELAWLFVLPPSGRDYWGTDWVSYRLASADNQISYYPTHYPASCFTQLGLFGLSAAEVPSPSTTPQGSIYQAFGTGGRFAPANDGSAVLGAPVAAPHYSAMIASLRPEETIEMWDWLINDGYFSPLNDVESLGFPTNLSCDSESIVWNQLKGSWNLSLQTLGWGRYLAERRGQVPILWQATTANPLLQKGYLILAPNGPWPILTPAPTRNTTPMPTLRCDLTGCRVCTTCSCY